MGRKPSIGVARTLFLAALAWMTGCSNDSPPGPEPTGSLDVTVTYQGTLGTVDAQHPVLARLYRGLNSNAQGVPDEAETADRNPDTLHFTDLPVGTQTLCVVFDVGGDELQQICPYEVFDDKAFGASPDPVVIAKGALTTLEIAFDDTHLRNPWAAMPSFALPDSNPDSPSYGNEITPADLQGKRGVVYLAEAQSDPLPDFALKDINPDSPTRGEVLDFRSWRGGPLLLFFGRAT